MYLKLRKFQTTTHKNEYQLHIGVDIHVCRYGAPIVHYAVESSTVLCRFSFERCN